MQDYTFLNPNYNLEHQHHSQASRIADSDTSKSAVNSATVYENMTIRADIRKMNNDYKKNYSLLNQDLNLAVDASRYFWKRGKIHMEDM